MIRRIIYTLLLLCIPAAGLLAQGPGKPLGGKAALDNPPAAENENPGAQVDTVFTIPDYNAELPSGADILRQDVSVKPEKKFHSTHMIGLRYGVSLASAQFSPDLRPGKVWNFHNYGIVYTYYNDLWDMLDNFGTQVIARLGNEGFTTDYNINMKYTVAELDMMCNLRFNINRLRIFANVGPYAGYRIGNDRPGGEWLYTDNRFDYGLIFGGGAGIMFGPFEFQLETNYKWGLSSYYHTYFYSDEYWLFAYPRVYLFSGTLYYKF